VLAAAGLKNTKIHVVEQKIVPDDKEQIQQAVKAWTDPPAAGDSASSGEPVVHLVLTTGGTGFSPQDVTPEALRPLLHRDAPGLLFAMLQASCSATPMGALSRPLAGTRHRTLILTLPGSPKAVPEILTPVLSLLPHAIKLMQAQSDPHPTAANPQGASKQ